MRVCLNHRLYTIFIVIGNPIKKCYMCIYTLDWMVYLYMLDYFLTPVWISDCNDNVQVSFHEESLSCFMGSCRRDIEYKIPIQFVFNNWKKNVDAKKS